MLSLWFCKSYLRNISFSFENAHHDWLTKECKSSSYLVSVYFMAIPQICYKRIAKYVLTLIMICFESFLTFLLTLFKFQTKVTNEFKLASKTYLKNVNLLIKRHNVSMQTGKHRSVLVIQLTLFFLR